MSAPAPSRKRRKLTDELCAAIIAAAPTAISLKDIARARGCSDQTVKYVLDREDPAIARRISARGRAQRNAENSERFEASQQARAEALAREEAARAEASAPASRHRQPALWALQALRDPAVAHMSPEAQLVAELTALKVVAAPSTEAEARIAIGLACGDLGVSVVLSLAKAS